MIAAIHPPGKNFHGVLSYALGKEGAYLIGPVQGHAQALTEEFKAVQKLNLKIQKPVWHMSVSLPPEEHLSDIQWEWVARQTMNRLGLGKNLYVVIRHTDEPQQHIHIVSTPIGYDGRVVNHFREKIRAETIMRELEKIFGLRRVPSSRARRRLSHPEIMMSRRRKQKAVKQLFQERIDAARRDRPTLAVFLDRLEGLGVGVLPNIAGNHVSGIGFSLGSSTRGFVVRKGSSLGRSYSWQGIRESIDYDPKRDFARLKKAKPKVDLDLNRLPPVQKRLIEELLIPRALNKLATPKKPQKHRTWARPLWLLAKTTQEEPRHDPDEERRKSKTRD